MLSFPIDEFSIVKITVVIGVKLLQYFSTHFALFSASNRKMYTKLITITVYYNRVSYAICFECFTCVTDYFYTFGQSEIDCHTMLQMVYALDYV